MLAFKYPSACFSTRSIESCEESSGGGDHLLVHIGFSTRSIESCEESCDTILLQSQANRFQYSLYRVV